MGDGNARLYKYYAAVPSTSTTASHIENGHVTESFPVPAELPLWGLFHFIYEDRC